jgi:glycosyltransferase involved in cell wall biosynthesis
VVTVRNYPMVEVRSPESRVQTPDSKFRLVHLAGTLSEERGTTSMVRAMELLDNRFELVLAGRFVTPGYEAEVRSMAGFERVRHTDTVPHEQVWSVYQECDAGVVCLLPLERYKVSLPVKMFEFMAAGLPLVASDFPLFRHLVEGNGCGICVDPESPEQIAAAARRLARDPGLVQQMGAMGRKAAREKYSWQAEQQTLLALYREIASVQLRAGTATVFRGRKAVAVPAPNPEAVGV